MTYEELKQVNVDWQKANAVRNSAETKINDKRYYVIFGKTAFRGRDDKRLALALPFPETDEQLSDLMWCAVTWLNTQAATRPVYEHKALLDCTEQEINKLCNQANFADYSVLHAMRTKIEAGGQRPTYQSSSIWQGWPRDWSVSDAVPEEAKTFRRHFSDAAVYQAIVDRICDKYSVNGLTIEMVVKHGAKWITAYDKRAEQLRKIAVQDEL